MKTYLDCYPCFLKQALSTVRLSTDDMNKQKKVLDKVMDILKDYQFDSPPPEIARGVYKVIKNTLSVEDPYYEIRKKDNENMLKMYKNLRSRVFMDKFSLFAATCLAASGNIIDCGVGKNNEVKNFKDTGQIFEKLPEINDFLEFKKDLKKAKNILYLGDNSGEIVLDKILIEFIKRDYPDKNIVYATRGEPVINDVTEEDAEQVNMREVAEIISNGDIAPGTILKYCSKEFIDIFNGSDLIIAKGQGNYESLSDIKGKNIYFLLLAKCPVIAYDLGVSVGSLIIKKGG